MDPVVFRAGVEIGLALTAGYKELFCFVFHRRCVFPQFNYFFVFLVEGKVCKKFDEGCDFFFNHRGKSNIALDLNKAVAVPLLGAKDGQRR